MCGASIHATTMKHQQHSGMGASTATASYKDVHRPSANFKMHFFFKNS
jgi:hypothetical protein